MWFLRIFHIVSKLPVKRVLAFSQKRQSNGLFSAFKIVLSCAIGLTLSMVMFTLLFSNDDNVGYTRSVKETKQHFLGLKFVKPKPKIKRFKNHKGKINGLNLLLIDSIQTECYVKEYLTIAKKSQDGQLGVTPGASVEAILGSAVAEQGYYPGTGVAVSLIPFRNGKIMWDKGKGWTLSELYRNNYTVGGGSLPPHSHEMTGDYIGPFQQTGSYFGNQYPKSNMNTKGSADAYFFPDEVNGLSVEGKNGLAMLPQGDYDLETQNMLLSLCHDPGPGFIKQELYGTKGDERKESALELAGEFKKIYDKYQKNLDAQEIESHLWKFIATIGLTENGWKKASFGDMGYLERNVPYVKQSWKILHGSMDGFDAWWSKYKSETIEAKTGLPPGGTTFIAWKGKYWHTSNVESAGHAFAVMYAGRATYARMLKFAGVDVDPTNPATYMNMVGAEGDDDGEDDTWTPDGEEIKWMVDAGVDVSKLSPDRVKALNYAHQYIGLPYRWGGTNPNTDGGLDCSGFVQWTMKNAMGKSNFGRDTIAQEKEGHEIPWSEARPGDLLFFGSHGSTHHVAFYLSGTNKSDVVYMDEPRTGKNCQIAKGATWESGSVWVLRLDNVYDDSVHYASNVDDNSGIQGGDLGAVGSTKNIDGKEFEVLPRNLIVPIPKSSYPSPMFSQQFGVMQSNKLYHAGDDIRVPEGTPVYAADDGVVIKSVDLEVSYGHHIVIRDDNSHTHTVYGHLTTRLVQKGDRVKRGQKIGISGSTGHSSGPHLHFEVRDMDNWGIPVDPFKDPGKRVTFGDINYVDRSEGKLYKEKSTGLW